MGKTAIGKVGGTSLSTGTTPAVVSPSGSTNTNASAAYLATQGIDMTSYGATGMNSTALPTGSTGLAGAGQKTNNVIGTLSNVVSSAKKAEEITNYGFTDSTTGITKQNIRDAYRTSQLNNFLKSNGKSNYTMGESANEEKITTRVWNQLTSSDYQNAYNSGYEEGYTNYANGKYSLGTETKQQISSGVRDWGYGFIKAADAAVDFLQDLGGGDTGIDALDILTGKLVGTTSGTQAAQLADANLAKWTFGANLWNQVIYSMTQNIADTALTMVTMGAGGLIGGGVSGAIEGMKAATGHSLIRSLTGNATNLSLAIMALRVTGDSYQENILNNPFATTSEAFGNALLKAGTEVLTEKMSGWGALGAQGAAQNTEGIIDAMWGRIADLWGEGTLMASMTAGFLGEGFEEIVSQFAGDLLNQAYYRAGSELGTEDKWSSAEDYLLAGLAGGISGAISAGGKYVLSSAKSGANKFLFEKIMATKDTTPNAVEEALGATTSPVKTQVAAAAAQQEVMATREQQFREKVALAQQAWIEGAQHSMQTAAELHNAGIQYRQIIEEIERQYQSASPEEAKSLFQKMQDEITKRDANEQALNEQRKKNIEETKAFMAKDNDNFRTIQQLSKRFGNMNVQAVLAGKESSVDAETALAIKYALSGQEAPTNIPYEMQRGTREQQQEAKAQQEEQNTKVEEAAKEKASELTGVPVKEEKAEEPVEDKERYKSMTKASEFKEFIRDQEGKMTKEEIDAVIAHANSTLKGAQKGAFTRWLNQRGKRKTVTIKGYENGIGTAIGKDVQIMPSTPLPIGTTTENKNNLADWEVVTPEEKAQFEARGAELEKAEEKADSKRNEPKRETQVIKGYEGGIGTSIGADVQVMPSTNKSSNVKEEKPLTIKFDNGVVFNNQEEAEKYAKELADQGLSYKLKDADLDNGIYTYKITRPISTDKVFSTPEHKIARTRNIGKRGTETLIANGETNNASTAILDTEYALHGGVSGYGGNQLWYKGEKVPTNRDDYILYGSDGGTGYSAKMAKEEIDANNIRLKKIKNFDFLKNSWNIARDRINAELLYKGIQANLIRSESDVVLAREIAKSLRDSILRVEGSIGERLNPESFKNVYSINHSSKEDDVIAYDYIDNYLKNKFDFSIREIYDEDIDSEQEFDIEDDERGRNSRLYETDLIPATIDMNEIDTIEGWLKSVSVSDFESFDSKLDELYNLIEDQYSYKDAMNIVGDYGLKVYSAMMHSILNSTRSYNELNNFGTESIDEVDGVILDRDITTPEQAKYFEDRGIEVIYSDASKEEKDAFASRHSNIVQGDEILNIANFNGGKRKGIYRLIPTKINYTEQSASNAQRRAFIKAEIQQSITEDTLPTTKEIINAIKENNETLTDQIADEVAVVEAIDEVEHTPASEQLHNDLTTQIHQNEIKLNDANDAILNEEVSANSLGEVNVNTNEDNIQAALDKWLEQIKYDNGIDEFTAEELEGLRQILRDVQNGTYNMKDMNSLDEIVAVANRELNMGGYAVVEMAKDFDNSFSAMADDTYDSDIKAWSVYAQNERDAGRIPTSCKEWLEHKNNVAKTKESLQSKIKNGTDTETAVREAAKEALKDKEVDVNVIKNLCKTPFTRMLVDIASKKGYTFYNCKPRETVQAFKDAGYLTDYEWQKAQKFFDANDKTMGLTYARGKAITFDLMFVNEHSQTKQYRGKMGWGKVFTDTEESRKAAIDNVIAHECIHTIVDSEISKPSNFQSAKAVQDINVLFDQAKRTWQAQYGNANEIYPFKSVNEFLCEMSNPVMRQWLANNMGLKSKFLERMVNFLHSINMATNVQTAESFLSNLYAASDILAEASSRQQIKEAMGESAYLFTSSQYLGWTETMVSKVAEQVTSENKAEKVKEDNAKRYENEKSKKQTEKLERKAKTSIESKAGSGVFSNLTSPFASETTAGKKFAVRNEETKRSIYYNTAKTKDGNDIRYYVFETRFDQNGKESEFCIAKINPGKDAYGNAVKLMKGANNYHYVANLNIDPYAIAELTPTVLELEKDFNGKEDPTRPVLGSSVVGYISSAIQSRAKQLVEQYAGKTVDMREVMSQAIADVEEANKDYFNQYMEFISAGAIDIDSLMQANPNAFTIEFSTEYDNGDVATVNKVWDDIEGEYKYANRTPVMVNFTESTELANREVFESTVNAFVDRFMQHGLTLEGEHFSFQTATANDLKHKKMRLLSSELIGNGPIANLRETVATLEEKINNRTATTEEYEKYKQAKTQLELNAGLDWEQIKKTGSKTLTNKGVGQTGSDTFSYIQGVENQRKEKGEKVYRVFNGEGKISEAIVIRDIFQQFSEQLMGVSGNQVGKLETNEDGTPKISGNWKEANDGMGLTDGSTFQMRSDAMGHKGVLCRADNWQKSIQTHGRETLDRLNTTTLYTDEFGRIYRDQDVEQLKAQGIEYWPMMGYNENKSEVGLYDVWGSWNSLNINSFTGKQVHHLLTESMVKFASSYKGTEDYYRWVGDKDIRVIPKENIYGSGFEDSVTEGLTEEQMQLKSVRKLAIRQMMRGMDVTDGQLEEAMSNTEKFCYDVLNDPEKQKAMLMGTNKTLDRIIEEHPAFLNSKFCKWELEKKLNRVRNIASYSTILTPAEQRQYSWILADPVNIISYLSGDVTDFGFARSEEAKREQLGDITTMPENYQGTSIPLGGLAGTVDQRRFTEEEATNRMLDREKVVAPNMKQGESVITRSPMTSKHDARPVMNDTTKMRKGVTEYGTGIDRDILYIQLNSSLMQRLDNDFDGDTSTMMQDAALIKIIMENVRQSRIAGTDNVTSFPHGKGRKMNTNINTLTYALKACMKDAGVGKYDTYLDRIYASNWLAGSLQEEYAAVAAAGYILATDYTKTGYMPEEFVLYVNDMVDVLNAKVDTDTKSGKTYAKTAQGKIFEIDKNKNFTPVEETTGDAFKKGQYHSYEKVAPSPEYYRYGNYRKSSNWTRSHMGKATSEERSKATNPERSSTPNKKAIPNRTNKFSNKINEYSLGIGQYEQGKSNFAWKKDKGNWFKVSGMKTGTTSKIGFSENNEESIAIMNAMMVGGQSKNDIAGSLKAIGPVKDSIRARLNTYANEANDYSEVTKARQEFAKQNGLLYNTITGEIGYKAGQKYISQPNNLSVPQKMSRMDEKFWTDYLAPCYNSVKEIVGDTTTAVNTLTGFLLDESGGFANVFYSYWADYIDTCREDGKVYDPISYMQDIFAESEVPNFAKLSADVMGNMAYVETEKGEPIFSALDDDTLDGYTNEGNIEYFDDEGNPAESTEDWLNSIANPDDANAPPITVSMKDLEESNGLPTGDTDAMNKIFEQKENEEMPDNPFDTPAEPVKPATPVKPDLEVDKNAEPEETTTAPPVQGYNEGVESKQEIKKAIKEKLKNDDFITAFTERLKAVKIHSADTEGAISAENWGTLKGHIIAALNGADPRGLRDFFNDMATEGNDNYFTNVEAINEHIYNLRSLYDKVNNVDPNQDDVDRYNYELQTTAERICAHFELMSAANTAVKNMQNEMTKAIKNEKYRWLFGKEGKGAVGKLVSKHIINQLSPGSLFRVLSGMNKDSETYKFGVEMEKADLNRGRMLGFYQAGLTSMLEDMGYNATKDKKKFIKELQEVRNEKTDFHGLTKGEVLNLYMAIQDNAGWYHLTNTGFEDGSGKIIKCDGKKGNLTAIEVRTAVTSIVRNDDTLKSASKMMRKVLDQYSPYVSAYREKYLGKLCAQSSVKENYWINHVGLSQEEKNIVLQDDNVRMMDNFISMQSRMAQPTGCIMKIDAFDSYTQYCNSMSKACSYGTIQQKLNYMSSKRNDNIEDYSLLNFLAKNGFEDTVSYVQDLSNDLNGRKAKQSDFNMLLSNFANSVLTGSIQTAVRQKASYWNALSQIPMEYLNKHWGLTSLDSTKFTNDARIKALAQYSGVIEMRRGDVDRVTSLRENIKRNFGEEINLNAFGEKIADLTPEVMEGMIPGVDVQTTCRIAFACWDYVKDQKVEWKEMSDTELAKNKDFMEAYASKAEEVIPLTQPMYGMLFRSKVQRSTGMERTMLMFRTQQGRNFNQLVEGYMNNQFNGDDAQFKMAKYGLGLSAVTYSALGLLGTILKGKIDKWEDEDGNIDPTEILKQFIKGTASAVYSTDWLGSYVGDFGYALVTGDRYYGFEANGIAQLNDFAENAIKTAGYIGDGKWGKAASNAWDTALSASQILGIPVENAINTFLAPIRVTMGAAELAGFNKEVEKEAEAKGITYTSPVASTVDSNDIVLSAIAQYNTKLAYEERAVALLEQYGIKEDTEGYSSIKSTVISKLKEADEEAQKASIPRATATGNAIIDEAIADDDADNYYRQGAIALLEKNGITKDSVSNYNSILSSTIKGLKELDEPQKTQALPTGNSVIDSAIESSNTTAYYSNAATALMESYGMTKDNTENYSTIHSQIVNNLKQMDKDYTTFTTKGYDKIFPNVDSWTKFRDTADTDESGTVTQDEVNAYVEAHPEASDYMTAYWNATWKTTSKKKF